MRTRSAAALLALLLLPGAPAPAAPTPPAPEIAGYPAEEALRLGERLYREGLLPSGEPVQALVQGDIPVDGTMFTCVSCHLRSGLGSTEGTVLTLPTNGARLFAPLRRGVEYDPARQARLPQWFDSGFSRPAYTDETLARALRGGVDPTGRVLSQTMPRYSLRERDMSLLVAYLRTLCAETSPGVTGRTITFATVVADDAPEADRRAMLDTLRAYVESHNVQTRRPLDRAGVDLAESMDRNYRLMELLVWELRGDRATWAEQLAAHYRARPVFALLGGISGGDWRPIHDFCESRRLPCLLPVTEAPVVSGSDWYTVYFSKGPAQEGEAIVRFLHRAGAAAPPLVVVRREGAARDRLLAGVGEALAQRGAPPPADVVLPEPVAPDPAAWRALAAAHPGAAFVLLLEPGDLAGAGELARAADASSLFFFSGEQHRGHLAAIPEELRPRARLTWPRRLPDEPSRSPFVVASWVKNRGVAPGDPDIHAGVYLLGWLLTDVFMMMGSDYYRDYFLDVVDMESDQTYASARYPRLSFGPGQRYASKGCFIVGIGAGPRPALTALSGWVIP